PCAAGAAKGAAGAGRGGREPAPPFPPNSRMAQFFRRFGIPDRMPDGKQQPEHRSVTGQGSGFFITADGYAVTNNHVVDKARTVEVTTDEGKTYSAKVSGTDPRTDIPLIKVDGGHDFPSVKLSAKTPRVGP